VSPIALLNELPVAAYLPANSTAYFTFDAPAVTYSQQTTLISVSASIGSPSLYVSLSDPLPSAASSDYSASWRTGGVVSIMSPPPPYTAYIAVQSSAYSRCNFTVVVTAYDSTAVQSTPIPLTAARPLASAIAAGEYRYYTYSVANGTVSTTIALTESYGQSYLLLNSPNNTALPTTNSAQYSSNSPTFPVIALVQPKNGTWTIGVWSSQSSAFSVIAVDNIDTLSMELGVFYPGYVASQQYSYYAIYLDAALIASATTGYFSLALISRYGDADLYCSYTDTKPTGWSYQWSSVSGAFRDGILVPISSLPAGRLYCGVEGFSAASYIFSASSAAALVILTPGETAAAESAAGQAQLYSMVFPAGNSLITLSVVSEVGRTELYIGGYGRPPFSNRYQIDAYDATVQLLSIPTSSLCGVNNTLAIPGSSPLLCEMQVTVVTEHPAAYRITATRSGDFIALSPGRSGEGAASGNQSAYFTFVIPTEESNATLLVTVTNGARGATMSVGQRLYNTINILWTVTQQPGSDLLVLQLDRNNPQAPHYSSFAGEYIVQLTAASASDPATFSVVYTVTNLNSTVVELLDGVPQASVATGTFYDFYYFTPPVEGWPYVVTFDVQWTSGWGTLRVAASNGPWLGPTYADSFSDRLLPLSGELGALTPDTYGVCNRSINLTCGYSISVQRAMQQYGEYTITVTAGNSVRQLYADYGELSRSVLSPTATDYWYTSLTAIQQTDARQLLVGVVVSSGSVTVLASNVTSAPNASTAMQTWMNVSSAAVLSLPITPPQSWGLPIAHYIAVLCASTDDTPCRYTLQAQQYVNASRYLNMMRLAGHVAVAPVTLLLPAGGMAWVGYWVQDYLTIRSLIFDTSVSLGTAELYACANLTDAIRDVRPNETASMWRATSAPLAIELLNSTPRLLAVPHSYRSYWASERQADSQPWSP